LVFERAVTLLLSLTLVGAAGATTLDDPMRPPRAASAAATAQTPSWTLESTLVADAQRSAIVNGRPVEVGDWVGGARVLAINPGRVRLAGPQGEFTLSLRTPTIRQEPNP
jgi:MSHA biogenesis protein MshK